MEEAEALKEGATLKAVCAWSELEPDEAVQLIELPEGVADVPLQDAVSVAAVMAAGRPNNKAKKARGNGSI
jgi:hypothetical protein